MQATPTHGGERVYSQQGVTENMDLWRGGEGGERGREHRFGGEKTVYMSEYRSQFMEFAI